MLKVTAARIRETMNQLTLLRMVEAWNQACIEEGYQGLTIRHGCYPRKGALALAIEERAANPDGFKQVWRNASLFVI